MSQPWFRRDWVVGRKRNERGFGLLESAVVMVVIAVLSAGVISYGGQMQNNAKANAIQADVMKITQNVDHIFANRADLPDLSDNTYAKSLGLFPDSPSHNYDFVSLGAGRTDYFIRVQRTNPAVCLKIGAMGYGKNFAGVVVKQGNDPSAIFMAPPVDPATLQQQCYKAPNSHIATWLKFVK